MTVSGTSPLGSFRCATCQANAVFCPVRRLKSYCSGALSPTKVRSGPMVPPRPLIMWQARQPLSRTSCFAEVDEVGALGLAVVAMADVAVHLHHARACRPRCSRPRRATCRGPALPSAPPDRAPARRRPPIPARRGTRCSRGSRSGETAGSPADACGTARPPPRSPRHRTAWWQVVQRSARPSDGTQICWRPDGTVFAFSSPNFSATRSLEVVLVVAPLVLAVVHREEHRREHEQQPDDGQHRPIEPRVRRVGASFHAQSLVGISGHACHGQ